MEVTVARRWGIIGTGAIAGALAEAITAEDGEVVAVSSASQGRADAFAARYGVANAYGRHVDLVADDTVEVVYVATTNERHHLDVLACIEAGLPVLAEKPFTLDADTARQVLRDAQDAGVFVMEAMWMKLQPAFIDLQRRIAEGEIGPPLLVQADFGIVAEPDDQRRWFSLEQGGGALLDVGIYPLTLAIAVLGPPVAIAAVGELAGTGVDEQLAVAMRHSAGVSAFTGSFVADSGIEATVAGPGGSLRLRGDFHHSPGLVRRRRHQVVDDATAFGAELGYRLEVREVHRCLDEGLTQSPVVPHEATIDVLEAMDEIRRQIGVRYPQPPRT
jgi:predicted dehydrogenase